MDYTQLVCPLNGIATAPADDAVLGYLPAVNGDILLQRLNVIVQTASSNANAKIVVETDASTPVVLGELTVGTSAAKTQLSLKFTEALKRVTSGVGIRVRQDGTATYAVFHWQLYTSAPNA